MNVEVSGEGPAIVALHGFTGNLSTWGPFIKAAQREYKVVAVDVLGHGASDAPNDPRRYSMDKTVEDLVRVLDHFGIEHTWWLGYSMGGRIALSAAVALTQRTAGLMVESGSPGLATAKERDVRVKADEALAKRIEGEGIEAFVDYWESLPMWASQKRLSQKQRESLRTQRLKNSPVGLANSLRGMGTGAQPSLHNRLGEIRVPALFVAGRDDAKFASIAFDMHRAAPGSRLSIVREAGHAVHLEQPEVFNQTVVEFLRLVKMENGSEASPQARSPLSL